jgi:hypothetical protein
VIVRVCASRDLKRELICGYGRKVGTSRYSGAAGFTLSGFVYRGPSLIARQPPMLVVARRIEQMPVGRGPYVTSTNGFEGCTTRRQR